MEDGGLVVLVVEDDYFIQSMVDAALREGGFESAAVASGEEAITLLKDHDLRYCALITDVHLAGRLNGWGVGKRARELKPVLPVIYMTGTAAEEWAANGVPHSVLLNKPFAPAQVVTAVAHLLNASAPPNPPA